MITKKAEELCKEAGWLPGLGNSIGKGIQWLGTKLHNFGGNITGRARASMTNTAQAPTPFWRNGGQAASASVSGNAGGSVSGLAAMRGGAPAHSAPSSVTNAASGNAITGGGAGAVSDATNNAAKSGWLTPTWGKTLATGASAFGLGMAMGGAPSSVQPQPQYYG